MNPIHSFAWRNGSLTPTDAIGLSPLQTGLLSGWGLFSTLRIYQGVPFALEDHWQRLAHDGERLLVNLDGLEAEIAQGLKAVIAKNNAQEAVARVYCIRNRGGLLDDARQARATDTLIFTRELRSWGTAAKLRLQPYGRMAQGPFAGTKTLTWAHNLVLVEQAHAQGFDDVLLLNERGEVAECTSANIFVARKGTLLTPPLSAGALAGVSRKVLLRAAPGQGLEIEEAVLHADDLERAEEIFITSTTREVQAVERIGERAVPRGPLTVRAAAVLRQAVEEYVGAQRAAQAAAR